MTTTPRSRSPIAIRWRINGAVASGRPLERASAMLDLLWREAGKSGERPRAAVASTNDFPTARASHRAHRRSRRSPCGRRSARDVTRRRAAQLHRPADFRLGRRSLFGGFVELPAGVAGVEGNVRLPAAPVAGADHWDLRLVVAVTTEAQKEVGSTEGMNRTPRRARSTTRGSRPRRRSSRA